ncbi:hypothetical protein HYW82_01835 [Candidatus Peregrinibacteria bacterium]|nr:hypothetical protein [Candidatus Peregrinibacteria bacterium]
MKKILISISMAVATGVVLLGVNGAFGLTAPTQNPADANLVSPVFGGLDVQGNVENTASSGNVVVNDGLDVRGAVKNTGGDVVIDDNLAIVNNLDVRSPIYRSNNAYVDFDDGVRLGIGKHLVLQGNGEIFDAIDDSIPIGSDLKISGNVNVISGTDANSSGGALVIKQTSDSTAWVSMDQNEIRSEGADLYLNYDSDRDVIVGGGNQNATDLDVRGRLFNGISNALWIDDVLKITNNLIVTGTISNDTASMPVKIDDAVDITGDIKNTSTQVVGGVTLDNPVKIDDSLFVNSNLLTNADLVVYGKIRTPNPVLPIDNTIGVNGSIGATDSITTLKSLNAFENLWVQGNADLQGTVSNSSSKPLDLADDVAVGQGLTVATDVSVGDDLTVAGGLDVNGAVTGMQFGTYVKVDGPAVTVTGSGSVSTSLACSSGQSLISCGFRGCLDSRAGGSSCSASTAIRPYRLYEDVAANTCYFGAVNESTSTRYTNMYITCLDPDL